MFIDIGANPDGMTLDEHGNLYIACGKKGIHVFSCKGERIGVIDVNYDMPSSSNCVFGGKDLKTLYITSRDKFLGIEMKVQGIKPWPCRDVQSR